MSNSDSRPAAIHQHGVEGAGWIDGIYVASLDLRPFGGASTGVAFAIPAFVLGRGAAMSPGSEALVFGEASGECDALNVR